MPAFFASLFVAFSVLFSLRPVDALPQFSQQYGVPCQKCHTAIPALTTFGAAFENNGYHIPGSGQPPPVFPIAVKANLLYTSAPDSGLPKAVVDEIEVLTAGVIGTRGNYFVEQYLVDGGRHGNLREAWFNERLTPQGARIPIDLRIGQFTLPVPFDPEATRETYTGYGVFEQSIGANPFNFFDAKTGVSARFGHVDRGLTFEAAALNGHDPQSGLATVGIDLMQVIHQHLGPLDLSVYRYAGRRDLHSGFDSGPRFAGDRFLRTGLGLRYSAGRWTSESVVQENADANPFGSGMAYRSSGGFSQLRYAITPKLFGLARYDGTNDDRGAIRSMILLLGYRLTRNSRLTVEDALTHDPATSHTISTQLTIAY